MSEVPPGDFYDLFVSRLDPSKNKLFQSAGVCYTAVFICALAACKLGLGVEFECCCDFMPHHRDKISNDSMGLQKEAVFFLFYSQTR